MAKERRGQEEAVPELNLAPIMNMVVILIPLLLLSVVFLQVGVINITAPKLSISNNSEPPPEPEEEPLNLTVSIEAKGLRITASGGVLPEKPGCPVPGPTICLKDQKVDTTAKFKRARELMAADNLQGGETEMKQALAAYDWIALYNELVKIKKQFPDENIIKVTGEQDMPYAAIVRAMDVARFKLEKDSYSKPSEFWNATYKKKGNEFEKLFYDPVLALAQ